MDNFKKLIKEALTPTFLKENKEPVLVDTYYTVPGDSVYKVVVTFDGGSTEEFRTEKEAEEKYNLSGVERETSEFDVNESSNPTFSNSYAPNFDRKGLDFSYDYQDIGQFYLDGFNKENTLTDEQLEKLGKKIVDKLYKGDVGKAYDAVVNRDKLDLPGNSKYDQSVDKWDAENLEESVYDSVGFIPNDKDSKSEHPNWDDLSADEIQAYIDANPSTLWGRSLSTAKMVLRDKKSEINEKAVNEMQAVNKKTGKDITKHIIDFLEKKISQKEFEDLTGIKDESLNEGVSGFTKIYQIATPSPQARLVEDLEELFGDDYRHIVTEFQDDEGYESILMFNLTGSDIEKIKDNIGDVLIWGYGLGGKKVVYDGPEKEGQKYDFNESINEGWLERAIEDEKDPKKLAILKAKKEFFDNTPKEKRRGMSDDEIRNQIKKLINEDIQPLAVEELTDEALLNMLKNIDDMNRDKKGGTYDMSGRKMTRAQYDLARSVDAEVSRRNLDLSYERTSGLDIDDSYEIGESVNEGFEWYQPLLALAGGVGLMATALFAIIGPSTLVGGAPFGGDSWGDVFRHYKKKFQDKRAAKNLKKEDVQELINLIQTNIDTSDLKSGVKRYMKSLMNELGNEMNKDEEEIDRNKLLVLLRNVEKYAKRNQVNVNEVKYRVEYKTQDGEKAKSRLYDSEEEAEKKEKKLVDVSGVKQAKIVKVEESVNETGIGIPKPRYLNDMSYEELLGLRRRSDFPKYSKALKKDIKDLIDKKKPVNEGGWKTQGHRKGWKVNPKPNQDQFKAAVKAYDKAESEGDIRGMELALAAMDLLKDESINENVDEGQYRIYMNSDEDDPKRINYEEYFESGTKDEMVRMAKKWVAEPDAKNMYGDPLLVSVTHEDYIDIVAWANESTDYYSVMDEELTSLTPNEIGDESKQDTSASGAYESKERSNSGVLEENEEEKLSIMKDENGKFIIGMATENHPRSKEAGPFNSQQEACKFFGEKEEVLLKNLTENNRLNEFGINQFEIVGDAYSACAINESKTFDFKKMVKEALKPDYLK